MGKRNAARAARIILALATVLISALLIIECADVYLTGTGEGNLTPEGVYINDIYSREIAAERFSGISWAFIVWLAALAAAILLSAVFPDGTRGKTEISPEILLRLRKARVSATPAMTAEERKRKTALGVCLGVCAVCGAMAAVYLHNPANFASRDLESVMGNMLINITPWIAAAFIAIAVFEQFNHQSVLRELESAKEAPKREPDPRKAKRKPLVVVGRAALYALAVFLIVAGIMNGGMYDVLVKAVNICTECIGLG